VTEPLTTLPWAGEDMTLSLPQEWRLVGVLQPSPLPGVSDPLSEVQRSLQQPIGAKRLCDMARPEMRVALVIDDASRPTPVSSLLPAVLAELDRAGVQQQDITLITALGLHRPMREDEVAQRVGDGILTGIHWVNHDCDDQEHLSYLGTTGRGTPVYLHKAAAQAELVVSIGCIEPHIIAGFGGGLKNLIPGIAGRETVAHNHTLNCSPGTFNMVGQPIAGNPMRLDLEEGARMLSAPLFLVNAVLNSALQVVRVVSGDPVAAHREGARVSATLYGVPIPRPADIVIADSHPMDQDLRQGVKALANTIRAVRPRGVHITMIRAEEGVGVFGLANRRLPVGRGALQALAPLLVRLVPRLKLQGMGEEDRFFLYFALQAMRHAQLLVYAPTVPAQTRAALPFVRFVDSPEEALAIARRRFPRQADVLVFPHGGVTYPVLG
jgi:nickel-dependent lactate racemase